MSKTGDTILDRILSDYDPDARPWPGTAQADDASQVRRILGAAAADLVRICPTSRELNRALNHLDEVRMWAEAAIERHCQ